MPGVTATRIPEQPLGSLSEMFFGLPEDGELIPAGFTSVASPENEALDDDDHEDEDEEKENQESAEEKKNFWESQHQRLQSTLCRTGSLESKIRNATKEILKDIQLQVAAGNNVCGCGRRPVASGACRSCLMREVSGRLGNAGYNSAICKSKWRSSPDIPSGEHTFMDVRDNSSTKKGEVRVIVELNFRAEFEMARASEEYNRLVHRLPELFVGKVERLSNVIKILCSAAKKCMKEKKMHMGPWRKQRYMQAKWLGACERTTSVQNLSMASQYDPDRLPKPRASMLTLVLVSSSPCFAFADLFFIIIITMKCHRRHHQRHH